MTSTIHSLRKSKTFSGNDSSLGRSSQGFRRNAMKRYCLSLAVILLAFSTAFAQQTAPAPGDAAASKEDIQKLFDVMQIHQQMRQVMDAMMKQQTAMIDETLKKRYPQKSAEKTSD